MPNVSHFLCRRYTAVGLLDLMTAIAVVLHNPMYALEIGQRIFFPHLCFLIEKES